MEKLEHTRKLQIRIKREPAGSDGSADAAGTCRGPPARRDACDFCGQRGHMSEECAKRRKFQTAMATVPFIQPELAD